jgi:hypothetical protein
MSSGHHRGELITLQFGRYANYVATHFWNVLATEIQQQQQQQQEEETQKNDSDSLVLHYFREVEGVNNQPTYTPRCVIFDEKHEWSSFRSVDDMRFGHNDKQSIISSLPGGIEVIKQEEYGMSKFTRALLASDPSTVKYIQREYDEKREDIMEDEEQKENAQNEEEKVIKQIQSYTRDDILTELEQKCRSWTDFLIPHLHPKSIVKLPDVYDGKQILSIQDVIDSYTEDSLDQIRFLLEEVDYISGIQLLSNTGDWWSCFTSHLLPQIRDEFGKIPIFSSLVQPYLPAQEVNSNPQFLKNFMSYSALNLIDTYTSSHYVLPLSGTQYHEWSSEYLDIGVSANPYKWSSILGLSFENLSRGIANMGLSNWISKMVPRNALSIGVLDARIPLGLSVNDNLHDFLIQAGPLHERRGMISLSPYDKGSINSDDLPFSQFVVFRGLDSTIDLYKHSQTADQTKLSIEDIFLQNVLRSSSVRSTHGSKLDYESQRYEASKRTKLSECSTYTEMLDRYIEQTPSYTTSRQFIEKPSPIPYTFPRIFNTRILNERGFVDRKLPEETKKIESIPMLTYAKTSGDITSYLSQLSQHLKVFARNGINLPGYELSKDEAREKVEAFYNLVENYRDD